MDGKSYEIVDLSVNGTRMTQQLVSEITGLRLGKHTIAITNKSLKPIAVDALIVQ